MNQKIELLKLPKPHSPTQKFIMNFLCAYPDIKEMYIACGTKFGKTLSASIAMSSYLWKNRNQNSIWVAPLYSQSKIGFNYCKRLLPSSLVKSQNSELKLMFDNSEVRFFHGGNPDSLEGHANHTIIFDEASKIKEEAYSSAKTTRTRTDGKMAFFSTPNGKNWFFKKCMEAKEEMNRAIFENRVPTKIFLHARTEDNPFIKKQVIEQARKDLPDRLFRQYYLAEFVDDGNVFQNYLNCFYTEPIQMYGDNQLWTHSDAKTANVVIGADWAKIADYTVFIAFDIKTNRVIGFNRFHKVTYTEAIRKLKSFCELFGEIEIVYHDKTGVGQAIDDSLAYLEFPCQGITFTAKWKNDIVSRLMSAFETEFIKIPNWNVLISELETYEVTTNKIGNMSYNAASGCHDDTVSALLLAYKGLLEFCENDKLGENNSIDFYRNIYPEEDDD